MLYDEFLAGTKARQTSETFEQYETLEKIYSACEDVSKEDIYRIWKQTYGKQAKLNHERTIKRLESMSAYRDHDGPATTEESCIRRNLFQAATSLTETNEFGMGSDTRITTPDGLTYSLERYDTINGHGRYRLKMYYEGKTYETALTYQFGDLIIGSAA
ncbi:hypothetical protein FACS1894187_04340 [Synergistales bacterium]|nr:hypothetical protein FACS1894187_04340 [Synergistales bacterium]